MTHFGILSSLVLRHAQWRDIKKLRHQPKWFYNLWKLTMIIWCNRRVAFKMVEQLTHINLQIILKSVTANSNMENKK